MFLLIVNEMEGVFCFKDWELEAGDVLLEEADVDGSADAVT